MTSQNLDFTTWNLGVFGFYTPNVSEFEFYLLNFWSVWISSPKIWKRLDFTPPNILNFEFYLLNLGVFEFYSLKIESACLDFTS